MAAEGRPRAGPGAEERGFPTADPTKTRGAHGPEPCPAGQARGEEEVAGLLLRAAGRRHHGRGGKSPVCPTRGRAPSPPQPAPPTPRAMVATRPARARPSPRRQRRQRWEAGGAEGRAGTRRRGKLGSGLFRFTGLAARLSTRAHALAGRAGSPAAPVRPAGRCARRVPPRASARAQRLGLSFLLPPARSHTRSLPEPGLIWSRWRQGVGAAQPPLLSCQYPAHSPARLLSSSLTRALARAAAPAAAARPGILSKFPSPPARALGPRRVPRRLPRRQPHASPVLRRKHHSPCLL